MGSRVDAGWREGASLIQYPLHKASRGVGSGRRLLIGTGRHMIASRRQTTSVRLSTLLIFGHEDLGSFGSLLTATARGKRCFWDGPAFEPGGHAASPSFSGTPAWRRITAQGLILGNVTQRTILATVTTNRLESMRVCTTTLSRTSSILAPYDFSTSESSSPSTLTLLPCTPFSTSGTKLSMKSKSRPTSVTVLCDFPHRG